jgi:hypothetical protein
MSTAQGAFGGGDGGRDYSAKDWANAPWRRGVCGTRWSGFEIIAMVLGFIVFWPIGLAILVFKYWQRKTGSADLQTVAANTWRNTWSEARSAMAGAGASSPRPWSRGCAPSGTGNHAFDEWKRGEVDRLEAERQKLEQAHREFAEFLDNVRKSKDREEFERFMNDRRNRT